jgi:hypothetical protein
MVKGRNLSLGLYSLSLDGLAQEAGALLRPLVETIELLAYLRMSPAHVNEAIEDRLPLAGERAKKIQGSLKEMREYLNRHASHLSFSNESMGHLVDWQSANLKAAQPHNTKVLRTNVGLVFAFLGLLGIEGAICLVHLGDLEAKQIASESQNCWDTGIKVFYPDAKLSK